MISTIRSRPLTRYAMSIVSVGAERQARVAVLLHEAQLRVVVETAEAPPRGVVVDVGELDAAGDWVAANPA